MYRPTIWQAGLATFVVLLMTVPTQAVPSGGVNDLNDGWVHVVQSDDVAFDGAMVAQVVPNDAGELVFTVEVWYVGAVGELPYRLAIGGAHFPHSGLAFSSTATFTAACADDAAACAAAVGPSSTFYSTGRAGVEPVVSADLKTHTYVIPLADLEAAHGGPLDGFAVWHDLQYKPRIPGGALYSGGAPSESRGDHKGADDDLCREGVKPWINCPASGGFASGAKNAAFFAGFGDQDPYENEGGDATGTPYGANDAVVSALGGVSSGPVAEVALKGEIDRAEYAATSFLL